MARACASSPVGEVALVGEVEGGFEKGERLDQPLSPPFDLAAERAVELALRLPALSLRLGVDQVGEALDGREVEAAVEKGAAGELAGLGRAAAGQVGERPEHGGAHREAAVDVEFRPVLAGVAVGGGEPGHEGAVEDVAGFGMAEGAQRQAAGRGRAAGEGVENGADVRAAEADDADAGAAGAGGRGEDGVGHDGRPTLSRSGRGWRA